MPRKRDKVCPLRDDSGYCNPSKDVPRIKGRVIPFLCQNYKNYKDCSIYRKHNSEVTQA